MRPDISEAVCSPPSGFRDAVFALSRVKVKIRLIACAEAILYCVHGRDGG